MQACLVTGKDVQQGIEPSVRRTGYRQNLYYPAIFQGPVRVRSRGFRGPDPNRALGIGPS
jgi:hypothetical protein